MAEGLIIVESPTKIKTLKKILGSKYAFASSMGHIRDLPQKSIGIDIEKGFQPNFEILDNKKDVVKELQKAAKKAPIVYLCQDPDREGEAIAWHLREILPEGVRTVRVVFRSITESEVKSSINNPQDIDVDLVYAQQARRLLDRLVGYKISPFLFRKLQRGKLFGGSGALSAGRVQSVALKFVVDREQEIESFRAEAYWRIEAMFQGQNQEDFSAELYSWDNNRILRSPSEKVKNGRLICSLEEADKLLAALEIEIFQIDSVERKERFRNPVPPFITSSLQQEASRYFSFSSSHTMSIAQSLYEGVDIGPHGTEGLITYMRTDSARIAPEAITMARDYIESKFGKEFVPQAPRTYSAKKSAQDSHECIRPTCVSWEPEEIRSYLSSDQFKIYSLIWKRFLAAQMASAQYNVLQIEIRSQKSVFRCSGSECIFAGFLVLYEEKLDDEEKEKDVILPALSLREKVLGNFSHVALVTKPKPRFTEASLIKELEKSGLGRPSTYAAIMNKIQSKAYTKKEKGRLQPTDLGRIVVETLKLNFPLIMDTAFTVQMEDELEEVSTHKKGWQCVLQEFWNRFFPVLNQAEEAFVIPKIDLATSCPSCEEGTLQKIWSTNRFFIGCSRYPDCSYTSSPGIMALDRSQFDAKFNWEQKCPFCQKEMVIREGKFGVFFGCTGYPSCKGSVRLTKSADQVDDSLQISCPAEGCSGTVIAKRSRFGTNFYGCNQYPECDVIGKDLEVITEKFSGRTRTVVVPKKKGVGRAVAGSSKRSPKSKKKSPSSAKTSSSKAKNPLNLSPVMAKLIGQEQVNSRQELLKKVWAYVKEHECQNPENKRIILPTKDELLSQVFGNDPVLITKLMSAIQGHIVS